MLPLAPTGIVSCVEGFDVLEETKKTKKNKKKGTEDTATREQLLEKAGVSNHFSFAADLMKYLPVSLLTPHLR